MEEQRSHSNGLQRTDVQLELELTLLPRELGGWGAGGAVRHCSSA